MYSPTLFENPLTIYSEGFDTYGSLSKQSLDISNIGQTYLDISRNIVTYDSLKQTLLSPSNTRYQDFSGSYLEYTDKSSTVKDAVKEDIHTMILQQNNSYIMGMVALSAVLITTFILLRK